MSGPVGVVSDVIVLMEDHVILQLLWGGEALECLGIFVAFTVMLAAISFFCNLEYYFA